MEQVQPYQPKNKVRIVTAASLFDGHDAAINIMRRIIQATGVEVIHLGHDRSVEEVVNTAIQEDANAIAITSYQGGHNEYFKYMFDLLKQKGAEHIKIFGGGGGVILPGVNANGDTNTTVADATTYVNPWGYGRTPNAAHVYDASFVKLRELQLGFNLPQQILKNGPFKSATLSFVGRNLALWSDVPHVDPEVMSFTGGTALPGIEYMSIPSSRSYGVNLNLKF